MSGKSRHIILKIENIGIYYNPATSIPWNRTNFPSKDKFSFNEREPIFWKVEMKFFDKKKHQLEIAVVDYNVHNYEAFDTQKSKYPIHSLFFQKLDWKALQRQMNYYSPKDFEHLIETEEETHERLIAKLPKVDDFKQPVKAIPEEKIAIDFTYPLNKVKFKLGFVEFEKKIPGIATPQNFTFFNDHIIPEFDHIKPFFAKALGKKKIRITGFIKIVEYEETKVHCKSEEIQQINEALIDSVKRLQLKEKVFNPKVIAIDKSILTPDEFFSDDENLGNIDKQAQKDMLDQILDLEGIRNRKQLFYLSGKLQNSQTSLKFTQSPQFGFLFHVVGEECDHFIWELLNSHATYMWSMEREQMTLSQKFKLLEMEINFIRNKGRRTYLNNEKVSPFIFSKVNHESSNSPVKDGFPRWKNRINEKLV